MFTMAAQQSGRTQKIWRDGQLINWDDAQIHVMSHVVHYGSSVFEGIRCYETPAGGAVFRLRDHMRRLVDSARIYRMPTRYSVDQLMQAVVDTVNANGLSECYLRPLMARTGEQMGVMPSHDPELTETFVVAWNWGAYLGDGALENGVDACVSSWRRAAPDTFPTLAKAGGNYLNSQLSKMQAQIDGYNDGIMLDSQGLVSEGSAMNLFVVRDDVLYTSSVANGILHGITRDSVMTIAQDLGYHVREQALPREFLYIADEVFFCGTGVEITPVRSIDRIPVGSGKPGPICRAIQTEFLGIARGTIDDRHGWLTPVAEPVGAAR